MNILLANICLINRSGTEVVTQEFLRALRAAGHQTAVYTPAPGPLAESLRTEGFTVFDSIEQIPSIPDIVHAHHFAVAAPLLLEFPATPQIVFCHDASAWHDTPFDAPLIHQFVAVDRLCEQRLIDLLPERRDSICVLHNAVDLATFKPRPPLPSKPANALIMAKNQEQIVPVEKACAERGIKTETLGPAVGRVTEDLQESYSKADLVFAAGRMAIEALAVGTAVIAADGRGLAGMVTAANAEDWREWNFGRHLLDRPLDPDLIGQEIDRYDARDVSRVQKVIRKRNGLDEAIGKLEAIYSAAISHQLRLAENRHAQIPRGRSLALEQALKTACESDWGDGINQSDKEFRAKFEKVVWSARKLAKRSLQISLGLKQKPPAH